MSSSRPAANCKGPRALTLDAESFQKLLAAAWAIQCERDRLSAEPGRFELDFCRDISRDEVSWTPQSRPAAEKPAPREHNRPLTGLPFKMPPGRAERPPAESIGALALVPEPHAALREDVEGCHDQPLRNTTLKVAGKAEISRPALLVVATKRGTPDHTTQVLKFLRSISARSFLAVIATLLLIVMFLALELARRPELASAGTSSQPGEIRITDANLSGRRSAPLFESSHLRITDHAASTELEELSRFELRALRRQAQFGDDNAALVVAMAYEIGQGVPQSCAEAAGWAKTAAHDGNPAAEYNFALRLLSGDGVAANPNEARRWMEQSANAGYEKAQLALQTWGEASASP